MKDTGLTEKEWEQIRAVLRAVPAIEKAVLFGSRAMGLARGNSDVDIMLYGEKLTMGDVAHARALLEETTLPYQFDLVLCDMENAALQEHVRLYGKVLDEGIESMSNTWKEYSLEDCLDALIDYRGKTPNKTDSGIPLVTAKIIKNGNILSPTEFISQDDYASWMRRGIPCAGDVVLTTEAPLGEVAQLDNKKVALAQRVVTLRGKKGFLDNTFLLYLLQTEDMQDKLKARSTGTTVLGIKQSELRKISLAVPPLPFQIQAASHLKALDDRIHLLRETNATLEAMAQALFKSWFVDFDPVHAKAEGRTPEGMDAETAALFPSEFEESEQGTIPKGWRVASYAETVSILSGGTPKTNIPSYWNGNIPWFSVVDAPRQSDVFVIDTEKSITESAIESSSAKILPVGTTIISARGTVGKLAITACQMSMNQSCYGLRGVYGDVYFTYFNTLRLVDELKCRTHGSVFDTITRSTFEGVTSIRPHSPVVVLFESSVSPLMERIKENLMLARTLTALRDTLLPRIISGKLRLPEFTEPTCEPAV